jgi:cell wall-associated NlpC family hydrolase
MRATLAVFLVLVILAVVYSKRNVFPTRKDSFLDGPMADAESTPGEIASNWARNQARIKACFASEGEARNGPCYDCSSFVYNAWKFAGKDIKAQNTRMYPSTATREVLWFQTILPGDILWRSGFTALYVGNNQVAAAANEKDGVLLITMENFKKYFKYDKVYRPL